MKSRWWCAAIVASAALLGQAQTPPSSRWPGFRGPSASGVADGQKLPDGWNGITGANIKWKVAVPGLAHSSPIVWDDRVFVTSAISSRSDATFKPGLYGAGTASEDRTPQQWVVMALDRRDGRLVWERTAYKGPPKEKRHIKATYANATPFTDGRYVVAFFGSQGLYAFDIDGRPAWQKDLGVLDVGAYDLPEYEWGTASSPIIYKNLVIVQCDTQKESFLLAADRATGKTVWKTTRQELPSWGTPTVYDPGGSARAELITNASNFVRGYDPDTGVERWRLGGSSKITAPTPIFSKGLVVVASGRAPERPLFAIRPYGEGDITPKADQESTAFVPWRKTGRGSYMPTPLIYGDILYVLGNAGLFDAYELTTGKEIYRQRLETTSGFSASPVAADGRIYLSSEDGDVFVVRSGRTFEQLGKNPMGEPLMATPALANGALLVRGEKHLFAIAR
jgi:outer membrane protein assembly factor BamB